MDIKTVDEQTMVVDPIYRQKKSDVEKMRTALLSCSNDNGMSVRNAIQSVTTMRVYHQLMRIVKYLEMMDKLEEKLYASLDNTLEDAPSDADTLSMLLNIQSTLQKNMIESHKLLQPYLDLHEFSDVDFTPAEVESGTEHMLMKSEERDRLRSSAQAVLHELKAGGVGG